MLYYIYFYISSFNIKIISDKFESFNYMNLHIIKF